MQRIDVSKRDESVLWFAVAINRRQKETGFFRIFRIEISVGVAEEADLFQNNQILELSQLSTPPLDYPIGVGDNIVVSLWGGADFEESYEVARDGSIFPQGLGKITVQGLTFDNARSIIYDRFKSVPFYNCNSIFFS